MPNRGADHPSAKLAVEQVREIFVSTEPARVLARTFGISEHAVYCIWHRRTWVHETNDLERQGKS